VPACEQTDNHRPPGPDGDADSDVDADADADADTDADVDADSDADTDADADADATSCASDDDCVLALDFRNDTCCPCPAAMNTEFVGATDCVETFPREGDPPAECAAPCECDACAEPAGVRCDREHCVVTFPGECETRDDCAPDELCVSFQGEMRCRHDPTVCEGDDDCDTAYQWCAPSAGGTRRCRKIEPGECRSDEQCAEGQSCEGATDDEVGSCA
jgi:hypothetical protein